GIAAISAVEAIRQLNRDCEITIVSKEREPAYTPCFLYRYVTGEIEKKRLYIRGDDFYDANRIKIISGAAVTEVMSDDNKVRLSDGMELGYDSLLIAAGSNPVIPEIPGIDGEGVFTFKTISDADRMLSKIRKSKEVVVIGAGFIGLEIAEALCIKGCRVTVVEREDRILPRMLDSEMAEIVQRHIEKNGIKILTTKEVVLVKRGFGNKVKGVMLNDGKTIPCDMVIVSVGVRPNLGISKNGSIKTDQGILVDDRMRTNISNIYAAGDIAEIEIGGIRKVNPIHINAVKSGWIAGCNMAGDERYLDAHLEDMNVVTFFGLPVLSIGVQKGEKVFKRDTPKGMVKVYTGGDGLLRGAQLIGDVLKGGIYLSLMRRGVPLSEIHPPINYGSTLRFLNQDLLPFSC
ncbi:MAG: NAD(P)/FAD-dependent oxidoreductase, partial [Nitrospirae bacterium]|nr:NAD(P)/FAD-dependent oxidoreductase [Nitrospirota bacterium]